MNHTIRSIRSPAFPFSLRRQIAFFKRRDGFTEDFIQLSAYTLGVIVLCFFFVSLFFSWNIGQEKAVFEQQQLVYESLSREQAGLKARRDKLLAKSRLVALAAAQLDLHLPETDQEHYLY
ncbi:Cell division protein FtsL [Candidatus Electrothrix laxa]